MNHRSKIKKLGKDRKHRKAMLRNLSTSLLKSEKIKTTLPKAKVLKSFVEKIITRSKSDTVHHRREVYKNIKNTRILKKLFEDIGKRYKNQKGGYTRIYKAIRRKGDGATQCYIELVSEKLDVSPKENQENLNKKKEVVDLKKNSKN